MTSSETRDTYRLASATASKIKTPVVEEIPGALRTQGAVIRARRGQTIAHTVEGNEALFVVRSGALMLRVTLPGNLRQVVALFYPGDVFRSSFAPPAAASQLSAVSASEVLRLRWSAFRDLTVSDSNVAAYYDEAVARLTARLAVHMTAIGQFDCQQRLATFLTELAIRTGTRAPGGGLLFDMPLSRTDMADYLALNADTLSRTISRLRTLGLLSHPERHRALVRDFDALAALSPAAATLRALCGEPMPIGPKSVSRGT